MARKNYLIEGGSGTGKTAICTELARRGYHAIHGDRVLAYQGDPTTGEPLDPAAHPAKTDPAFAHAHHIWDVPKVKALLADQTQSISFFCGGSRNFSQFIGLFDEVFVLDVDLATLHRRLDNRPNEWGSHPAERALIVHLHMTQQDIPDQGIHIDARAQVDAVVDDILARCGVPTTN